MPSVFHSLETMKLVKRAAIAAMATSILLLAGCSLSPTDTATSTVMPAFGGTVHGGQSPIQGATVNLYLTDPAATGYGTSAIKVSSTTSDVNGNFSFPTAISSSNCTSPQQAYVTSSGGYPPGQTTILNNAILLTAALGDCTTINSSTFVTVNELTTVAFAYALSGFTSTTTQGSGYTAIVSAPPQNRASTPSLTLSTTNPGGVYSGLQHAFKNATSLVNFNGGANATITASTGGTSVSGSIPVAFLNTLADIMQYCVNSGNITGTVDAQCTTLFNGTPSVTGALATNTLQAFLNLARNPGSPASLAAYTGIQNFAPANGAFYPALSTTPSDWALAISYNIGAGIPITTLPKPYWLALDANDTVYYGGSAAAQLTGLSPYGATVPAFAAGTTGSASIGIATDLLGNIWLSNGASGLYRFNLSTGAKSQDFVTLGSTYAVGIDKQNNVWVSHKISGSANIDEFNYITSSSSWGTTANYTAQTAGYTYGLNIDANQNIWTAPYGSPNTVDVLANIGTTASPTYTSSGTSITPIAATLASSASNPYSIAFDVNGNAWYGIYGAATQATAGTEEVVPNNVAAITSLTPQALIPGTQAGAGSSSGNLLGNHVTNIISMDGSETLILPDNNGTYDLHVFSTTTGRVISPTGGIQGCLLTASAPTVCASAASSPRDPVIDSTGTVWAGYTSGGITQFIGLAAPTYPVLAVGQPGLSPGLTAANPLP